jgi:dihydroorotate dehydrogenase electron transfer subunit
MIVDVHARVRANTRLSTDYCVVALEAPAIAAAARPGQFVMIRPRSGLDPLLRRPFSIFEILRDAGGQAVGITLLNKRVGVGSGLLYDAAPGDHVDCLGPLGRAFEPPGPGEDAWMVAGGVGLAPFATLTDAVLARGATPVLFYGARRAVDLHCADRFEQRGVRVLLATEDGSRGDAGLITAPLARELAARGHAAVRLYACGPTPMMRAVAALAARERCRCDVSLEQVMGCGLGGCYSCVVEVRGADGRGHFVRSCVNGPVFDAADLLWHDLGH